MRWGKKSKKNLVFTTFFVFWSILLDPLVPWSPWVTMYTGGLSQLPVVEMSWEKNSKKKPSIHYIFCFLVNFVRPTGPMVTMGHQVHRCAISASSGRNELGKKFLEKNPLTLMLELPKTIFSLMLELL